MKVSGIRQQLAGLAAKLKDPRFDFMFRPGDWLPALNGVTKVDLDALLVEWIGGPQPISILDLSGIPSSVLDDLIGALLRILYDALFFGRATCRKAVGSGRYLSFLKRLMPISGVGVREHLHPRFGALPRKDANTGSG